MAEVGIDRHKAYLTNAVKHFKFEQRGQRRIHAKPTAGEVKHYRPWLMKELELVGPKLVVALGGTALLALTGKATPIIRSRGEGAFGPYRGYVTVHPSYLLRLPDEETKRRALRRVPARPCSASGTLPGRTGRRANCRSRRNRRGAGALYEPQVLDEELRRGGEGRRVADADGQFPERPGVLQGDDGDGGRPGGPAGGRLGHDAEANPGLDHAADRVEASELNAQADRPADAGGLVGEESAAGRSPGRARRNRGR